jgi:solute carrier family 13 (sodium-dependent dicarboxylate transporter), member 2/3/5
MEAATSTPRSTVALLAGPTLAALMVWYASAKLGAAQPLIPIAAGLAVWMAVWWLLEPVPAPVTALLPFALGPMFGVLNKEQLAASFGNELILLLAGGFMISQALERSGAHRRLAYLLLRVSGNSSGRRILLGFILATGLLSMWISNTATTLMMLPVALAVLEKYPDKRLQVPLILAIAYAASLGGMGTPIGTPPNLVFMQVYTDMGNPPIGFLEWMRWGIPLVAISLPLLWLWLGRNLSGAPAAEFPPLGPITAGERRVLVCFTLIAAAWITRSDPWGGWSAWINSSFANDAAVAMAGVILLCLIPSGTRDEHGNAQHLLSWESAERIPWGALVVFAGGIALATAIAASGLSELMASKLTGLASLPVPILLLGICVSVTLISEIASNTATAVLLMPILASTAKATGIDPALLMLPAALAASLGFMLPVATAPNAVAYATGKISNRTMLREGWMVDVIGVLVVSVVAYFSFGNL